MSSGIPRRSRPLTPIEVEVLQMLANGLGRQDVAQVRGRSINTVSDQISSVMRKLGACSVTNAVAQGFRQGVLK